MRFRPDEIRFKIIVGGIFSNLSRRSHDCAFCSEMKTNFLDFFRMLTDLPVQNIKSFNKVAKIKNLWLSNKKT